MDKSSGIRAKARQTDANPLTHTAHYFPQLWFLLATLLVFGAFVSFDLNIFALIISLDKSYMASLIMALVVVMSVHCGWHIFQTSVRASHAIQWLSSTSPWIQSSETGFLQGYLRELSQAESRKQADDSEAILEVHADNVRAPSELGWFFVDLTVRLGLLGTIIGFILIFSSLDKIEIEGGDDLKNLLIAMSGGMGTALYTTLTGLIGATILSFQYLILGRQSEHLVGLLLRIKHRFGDKTSNATL